MELQKEITPELFDAIKAHYESGSYSNAILDAMKVLTELIREKAKLDGDGANLVSQAFGGNAPPIKISPMQKVSEIDEQKGFEQLLRGLYVGIRNPRTHENF
ncbi:MAG: TIGR02391 family protein [Pseudomonadota bacterium]